MFLKSVARKKNKIRNFGEKKCNGPNIKQLKILMNFRQVIEYKKKK